MGIRLPLTTVLDAQNNGLIGAASVNGGIAHTFNIPQDADNIVVKFIASTVGGGVSTTLQTTDDGGTTWYDVARTSTVSNAISGTAQWLSSPVVGIGVRTTYVSGTVPSVGGQAAASIYGAIGSAAASTVGQLAVTGLPILSPLGRVFHRIDAAVTGVTSVRVQVKVNSESER